MPITFFVCFLSPSSQPDASFSPQKKGRLCFDDLVVLHLLIRCCRVRFCFQRWICLTALKGGFGFATWRMIMILAWNILRAIGVRSDFVFMYPRSQGMYFSLSDTIFWPVLRREKEKGEAARGRNSSYSRAGWKLPSRGLRSCKATPRIKDQIR